MSTIVVGHTGRSSYLKASWLADYHEATLRLTLAAAGATPVTLIAATAFGVAGLRTLATYVLVPMVAVAALIVRAHRPAVRLLCVALVAGPVATLLYDGFRFGFLAAGFMHGDPIPHIGTALHLEPAWAIGYAWRYLGNGTGLAVAFLALGLRGVRAGVLYGLFVCAGLLVTLIVSPYGQHMLFALTPATVVMAIGGHAIYGAALGMITGRCVHASSRWSRRSRPVQAPDRGSADRHVARAAKPTSSTLWNRPMIGRIPRSVRSVDGMRATGLAVFPRLSRFDPGRSRVEGGPRMGSRTADGARWG